MATDLSPDDSAHQVTRRVILRLALATPVAAGLGGLPALPSAAQRRPVAPRVRRLRLGDDALRRVDIEQHVRDLSDPHIGQPGELSGSDDLAAADLEVYASGAIPTETFRVAGFTWKGDHPTDVALLIRTRARSRGEWSDWVRLRDDSHEPDPDSAEAATARRGTDAVIVEEAEAVEVRVESPAGGLPSDLALELIDPGESPADVDVGKPGVVPHAESHRLVIHARADWGADESMRGDPEYAEVRGMFVHHTAGSNTYGSSDVPGIIRGIYAYHVNGRGWRDIGYNFLIDKFGGIWEGRHGGIDRAVIGAHTLGYNTYAFAASVLGTYTSKEPESAALRAYERLIAWKFSIHGVNPSVSVDYPDLRTLPPVAGHRNAGATECPGAELYTRLETIRSGAAALMGYIPRAPAALRLEGPSSASEGSMIRLDVRWSAGGWVTGTVTLQHWNSGAWGYLRQIHVKNGKASVYVLLDRTRTYRVYGSAPGVEGRTSKNVTVTATARLAID